MSNAEKWADLDLKPGDRVRIVCEDTVLVADGRKLETLSNLFMDTSEGVTVVSVEKIGRPLPTEPGTVFRARLTMGDESAERTVFVTERDHAPRYVLDRSFCGYGGVRGSDEDLTVEVIDRDISGSDVPDRPSVARRVD